MTLCIFCPHGNNQSINRENVGFFFLNKTDQIFIVAIAWGLETLKRVSDLFDMLQLGFIHAVQRKGWIVTNDHKLIRYFKKIQFSFISNYKLHTIFFKGLESNVIERKTFSTNGLHIVCVCGGWVSIILEQQEFQMGNFKAYVKKIGPKFCVDYFSICLYSIQSSKSPA